MPIVQITLLSDLILYVFFIPILDRIQRKYNFLKFIKNDCAIVNVGPTWPWPYIFHFVIHLWIPSLISGMVLKTDIAKRKPCISLVVEKILYDYGLKYQSILYQQGTWCNKSYFISKYIPKRGVLPP